MIYLNIKRVKNLTNTPSIGNTLIRVLSCLPRVTVTPWFVYKVIRDLELIDHVGLSYPQDRINMLDISIRVSSRGVYKLMFYLTIVRKT